MIDEIQTRYATRDADSRNRFDTFPSLSLFHAYLHSFFLSFCLRLVSSVARPRGYTEVIVMRGYWFCVSVLSLSRGAVASRNIDGSRNDFDPLFVVSRSLIGQRGDQNASRVALQDFGKKATRTNIGGHTYRRWGAYLRVPKTTVTTYNNPFYSFLFFIFFFLFFSLLLSLLVIVSGFIIYSFIYLLFVVSLFSLVFHLCFVRLFNPFV